MNAILGVLGESSVRAIIIAFTTVCVLRTMRVKSPAIRHRAWTGVLLAMLCLPFFSQWAPRIAIPVLPAHSVPAPQKPRSSVAEAVQAPDSRILVIEPATLNMSPLPASKQSRIANQSAFRLAVYRIAGILYLAGFCLLAFRLLTGTLLLRRLARGSSLDGRIFYSPQCTAPMTVGLFRARILLPAESMDWDPGKLDAVLAHEMEHMRRRDPLIEWLALLNRSLYWFNPLAWWLCCKLSALSEQVCDEAVLARGHDSSVYASHLLEFARAVKRRGSLVTTLGSSLNGSTLSHRIRRILNSGVSPAISPTHLFLVTAVWVVAALIPLFLELSPVHAAPPHGAAVGSPLPIAAPAEIPPPETPQSTVSIPQSGTVAPPDKTFYETGREHLQQHQFIKARLAFQSLISSYPNSSLAASAYLAIPDSYYEEGGAANMRSAEEQYRNFVVFFPRNPKTDDAYMKIISINMKAMRSENGKELYRGNMLRVQKIIQKFISSYPDSGYHSAAEKMLQDLNRELANQRLSNITGYVVNEAGKPIRGVAISAFEKADIPLAPVDSTLSDQQGYFILRDMPLDNKMEMHFDGESMAPFVYDGPNLFSEPLRITIQTVLIERIDIKGNRRITQDTIRFYIQTRPGEQYSRRRLELDMQSLYRAGFFENVKAEERDGQSGKIITFIVDEKPLIRSVRYVGNRSVSESEILEAFKENKAGLAVDSQFEYRKVMLAERILKKLLVERGKQHASVRVETESLPPDRIRLRFIIDEDGN